MSRNKINIINGEKPKMVDGVFWFSNKIPKFIKEFIVKILNFFLKQNKLVIIKGYLPFYHSNRNLG